MNNEKKTRLAALVGALGAVLLLVQSGRLPEVKSWLLEKRSRRYETADRISAYLTRKAIPWDRRTWERFLDALPLLLFCTGMAMFAFGRLLKKRTDKGEK